MFCLYLGFPSGSVGAGNPGDASSILGWEDPLEESMATHSNILAWRIPWTEEPDGRNPQCCRVGHDRSNWAHGHTLLVFDRSDLLSCTKGRVCVSHMSAQSRADWDLDNTSNPLLTLDSQPPRS